MPGPSTPLSGPTAPLEGPLTPQAGPSTLQPGPSTSRNSATTSAPQVAASEDALQGTEADLVVVCGTSPLEEASIPVQLLDTPSGSGNTSKGISAKRNLQFSTPGSTTSNTSLDFDLSFEMLMCKKFSNYSSGLAKSDEPPAKKRKRIDPQGRVLTLGEAWEEIENKEKARVEAQEKKLEKAQQRAEKKALKEAAKKEAQAKKAQKKTKKHEHTEILSETENESSEDEEQFMRKEGPSARSTSDEDCPESSEDESIDAENVHFNKRNYSAIRKNIDCDKYYVVCYGDLSYVGKVVAIQKETVTVQFMVRKPDNKYDWPVKKKIEDVDHRQLICGPLKLSGGLPFTVRGVCQTIKDYIRHMKSIAVSAEE